MEEYTIPLMRKLYSNMQQGLGFWVEGEAQFPSELEDADVKCEAYDRLYPVNALRNVALEPLRLHNLGLGFWGF